MVSRILLLIMLSVFLTRCSNPPHPTPDESDSNEMQLTHPQKTDSLFIQVEQLKNELDSENTLQDNKLKVIDDRTKYLDSVYFEMQSKITLLENDVKELRQTVQTNVLTENNFQGNLSDIQLTDEEFRSRYIDALANYQNGNYEVSLKSFNELLRIDKSHDLSDNCQYWIGEIYYAQKDFSKALSAFKKTLEFPLTNKADHAQYKIGLCYLNIGDKKNAEEAFKKHITEYPNSEHYKSSVDYINNNK